MNKQRIKHNTLFIGMISLILSNSALPKSISWEEDLIIPQQATYNLLCFALGITGNGITYLGMKELVTCTQNENSHEDNKIRIPKKIRWLKLSIGLCIITAAFIALFQFDRLDMLLSAEVQ